MNINVNLDKSILIDIFESFISPEEIGDVYEPANYSTILTSTDTGTTTAAGTEHPSVL